MEKIRVLFHWIFIVVKVHNNYKNAYFLVDTASMVPGTILEELELPAHAFKYMQDLFFVRVSLIYPDSAYLIAKLNTAPVIN